MGLYCNMVRAEMLGWLWILSELAMARFIFTGYGSDSLKNIPEKDAVKELLKVIEKRHNWIFSVNLRALCRYSVCKFLIISYTESHRVSTEGHSGKYRRRSLAIRQLVIKLFFCRSAFTTCNIYLISKSVNFARSNVLLYNSSLHHIS